VFAVTLASSLALGIAVVGLSWKYRRRREDQRSVPVGATPLFVALAVSIPLALFLSLFTVGFRDFVELQSPPADAMEVYVSAKQWVWEFAYPDGPNAIGTLTVPANRPVRLLITSRDVIHSLFIPSFRVKMAAQPGRWTQVWFNATTPGRYPLLCTELCGTLHSKHGGEVVVLAPAAFDAWMKEQRKGLVARQDVLADRHQVSPLGDLVEVGKRVAVEQGCLRCHNATSTDPATGPSWVDLYQQPTKLTDGREILADEAYLTESMMEPTAKIVAGYQALMLATRGSWGHPRPPRSSSTFGVSGPTEPSRPSGGTSDGSCRGAADCFAARPRAARESIESRRRRRRREAAGRAPR